MAKAPGDQARNSFSFAVLGSQILGPRGFRRLGQFFVNLLQECVKELGQGHDVILVLLTRRCHVLFQIFLEYFQALKALETAAPKDYAQMSDYTFPELKTISEEMLERIKAKCITDYNFLALAPVFADYYREKKQFPRIIIADELLIHGRAFNRFLMDMEERVAAEFPQISDKLWALQALEESMELRVYAQSGESLLLLDRYAKKLRSDRQCSRIVWRDISARLAQLISVASVNNISYSWGLRVPLTPREWEERPEFSGQYPSFRYYMTGLQNIREENFIYLYPTATKVKAICSVRMKKSLLPMPGEKKRVKGSWILAPYIAFDHLELVDVERLHRQILQDVPREVGNWLRYCSPVDGERAKPTWTSRERLYYRWLCETNELVLEHLLFLKFTEEVRPLGKTAAEFSDYVDYEMMARNYCRINEGAERTEDDRSISTMAALKALWAWQPGSELLERYLSILLEDTAPLWAEDPFIGGAIVSDLPGPPEIFADDPVAIAVENAIARIGNRAERNAFERTASGVLFSEDALARWGVNYSVGEVVEQCDSELYGEEKPFGVPKMLASIYQVAALLTQAMDLGQVGMSPFSGEDSALGSDRADQIYTMPKAGEQALFILPIRYRRFLPVLLKMQERWKDREAIQDAVRRFANAYCIVNPGRRDAEELAEELNSFLEGLWETGQGLEEWDISLYDFPSIDYPSPSGENVEAVSKMIEDVNEQMRNLEIYRRM